jgi:histidinol-phosphate aminotransferase
MFDPDAIVRKNVKALIPYSSARDEYQGKEGIFLDANENPYGNLNRYPDPYQRELKKRISEIKKIPFENIFLGNGSDEIIDLCFRIFCSPGSEKALTFSPTYGMYEVAAGANDVRLIKVPLDENFQIDFDNVKPFLSDPDLRLILICSPNNPTGNLMNRKSVESIISGFKGIVLIDEAYIDFSGEPSFMDKIDSYPNLVVMQTFSKAYGMASVRVGLALANSAIVHYFNKMKPPYNISTLNQRCVLKNLRETIKYKNQVDRIKSERSRMEEELKKIPHVIRVFPSDANFLLVRVKEAGLIYTRLVEKNIIVRNRSSVISNCLRITIGTARENNRLLRELTRTEV